MEDFIIPDIGVDMTPTPEMIAKGKIGNGVSKPLDKQMAETIQKERREMKRREKESRREAYEEGVKDALGAIANFEQSLMKIGSSLLDKVEHGKPLTKSEVETLKLIQSNAENMKNRALGRPVTRAEVKQEVGILHLIAGLDADIEVIED